jgi:methyl coenzyme M reductase gamma subunit
MDWSNAVTSGEYIIIDCYRKIDPTQFTDVYNDVWLKKYVTALIKKQWGQNLSKFEGVQLPGGVTLQGRQILEDANTEIEKLEEQSNLLQTESAIMMG